MLITGMNHKELLAETSEDLKRLNLWFQSRRTEMIRWSTKQKLPAWYCNKWTSPNKNIWNIMVLVEKQKYSTGPIIQYTKLNSDHGHYIIKPQLVLREGYTGFVIYLYLPHFFKRYRERMELSTEMKTEQVVRLYLKNNSEAVNMGDENNVELTSKEGIALGNRINDRLYILRTYIPYSMSRDDQISRFNAGNSYIGVMPSMIMAGNEIASEMREVGIDPKILKSKQNKTIKES